MIKVSHIWSALKVSFYLFFGTQHVKTESGYSPDSFEHLHSVTYYFNGLKSVTYYLKGIFTCPWSHVRRFPILKHVSSTWKAGMRGSGGFSGWNQFHQHLTHKFFVPMSFRQLFSSYMYVEKAAKTTFVRKILMMKLTPCKLCIEWTSRESLVKMYRIQRRTR